MPDAARLSARTEALIHDGRVDFAALDPSLQSRVLAIVCGDRGAGQELRELNPWIESVLSRLGGEATEEVRHNAEVVRRDYAPEVGGRRLRDLYRSVLAADRSDPVEPIACADHVLDAFLDLPRFHPIRVLP